MIYKIPVLFQLLLVMIFSFSPLKGMEGEQAIPKELFPSTKFFNNFEDWKKDKPQKAKDILRLLREYGDQTAIREKINKKEKDIHSHGATFGFDFFLKDGRVVTLDFDHFIFSSNNARRSDARTLALQLDFERKYQKILLFPPDEDIFYHQDSLKNTIKELKSNLFSRQLLKYCYDYVKKKEEALGTLPENNQGECVLKKIFNNFEFAENKETFKLNPQEAAILKPSRYQKPDDFLGPLRQGLNQAACLENLIQYNKILFPLLSFGSKKEITQLESLIQKPFTELSLSAFFQQKMTGHFGEKEQKIIDQYGDWNHSEEGIRFFWTIQQNLLKGLISESLKKQGVTKEQIEGYELSLYSFNKMCFSCHTSLLQELIDDKEGNYTFWHSDLIGEDKFFQYALFYQAPYSADPRIYQQSSEPLKRDIGNVKISELYKEESNFYKMTYEDFKNHALFVNDLQQKEKKLFIPYEEKAQKLKDYTNEFEKAFDHFLNDEQGNFSLKGLFDFAKIIDNSPIVSQQEKEKVINQFLETGEKLFKLKEEEKTLIQIFNHKKERFNQLGEQAKTDKTYDAGDNENEIFPGADKKGGKISEICHQLSEIKITVLQEKEALKTLVNDLFVSHKILLPKKALSFPLNIQVKY